MTNKKSLSLCVIYIAYVFNFLVRNLCIFTVFFPFPNAIQIPHEDDWVYQFMAPKAYTTVQFPRIPVVQEMSS